jgi:serine/threonine-protein kinase/endoribonuclease IRE1
MSYDAMFNSRTSIMESLRATVRGRVQLAELLVQMHNLLVRGAPTAATAASGGGGEGDVPPPLVGAEAAERPETLTMPVYPSRPGKQHCGFFIKTGHCRYGGQCAFDHPPEFGVQLTEAGLPFRPGQPVCGFYHKTLQCKFGPSCKFHHPKLVAIYAGSAAVVAQGGGGGGNGAS